MISQLDHCSRKKKDEEDNDSVRESLRREAFDKVERFKVSVFFFNNETQSVNMSLLIRGLIACD